jgi:hypothetical protein
MKKRNQFIGALLGAGLAITTGVVLSDDDYGRKLMRSWFEKTTPGIGNAESELYVKECGGCHFPYQPGLLPAVSWERIMLTLEDHFGENAELESGDRNAIMGYLLNNAAGRVNYGLPNKIMAAQKGRPMPLRVTEMRYFVYEHSELSKKMVQDNPEVKSFSNCGSCHPRAMQGLYDEHDVRIPGFGRWDDD